MEKYVCANCGSENVYEEYTKTAWIGVNEDKGWEEDMGHWQHNKHFYCDDCKETDVDVIEQEDYERLICLHPSLNPVTRQQQHSK